MYTTADIKELVKDRKVFFDFYRDHELWYRVEGTNFKFPVSIEEAEGGNFNGIDKAILYMRYIRKHLKSIEEGFNDGNQG